MGTFAANVSASQYKLEVALIYKLAKFVHWPAPVNHKPDFGVCVLGNPQMKPALMILAQRKLKSKPIKISQIKYSEQATEQCQVIFIDPSRQAFLKYIFQQLKDKPVLLLSTSQGFAEEGGMIEFSIQSKPIQFVVNLAKIKQAGLEVSAPLLKLATVIEWNISRKHQLRILMWSQLYARAFQRNFAG